LQRRGGRPCTRPTECLVFHQRRALTSIGRADVGVPGPIDLNQLTGCSPGEKAASDLLRRGWRQRELRDGIAQVPADRWQTVQEGTSARQTAQIHVLGFIDHTHPAAAEFLQDVVMRDGLADHGPDLGVQC